MLKDKILNDMKDAMRSKDKQRLETIRLVRAAIQRREVDDRAELDEAGVVSVIEKMVKQGKDSIEQFAKGKRQDLVDKEEAMLVVIEEYLPKQLSEAEVDALIDDAFAATGAKTIKEMGKVMGWIKPKGQGKVDMSLVSAKIKQRLFEIYEDT
jgi:uncharacterized protein YqeY